MPASHRAKSFPSSLYDFEFRVQKNSNGVGTYDRAGLQAVTRYSGRLVRLRNFALMKTSSSRRLAYRCACAFAVWILISSASALGQKTPGAIETAADFPSLESVIQLIPADLKLKKGGDLDPVAGALASTAMNAKTKGKRGQIQFKVGKIEAESRHGQKFRVRSDPFPVQVHGGRVECVAVAYFTEAGASQLTPVKAGSTITVVGTFIRSDLAPPDVAEYRDKLVLVLKDCAIVPRR